MAKQEDVSARRLFDKLGASGASKYVFTGMIKQAEDDQTIMVAAAGDCSKWVQIPARHVQDVEFIQSIQCGGHMHPLVHIYMKDPDSSEAKAFAALAMLHQGQLLAPNPPMTTTHTMVPLNTMAAAHHPTMAAHANLPPGTTPCYWDWGLRRWVCP